MEPYTRLEEKLFWSFCDKIINRLWEIVKGKIIWENYNYFFLYEVVGISSNNENKHKYM